MPSRIAKRSVNIGLGGVTTRVVGRPPEEPAVNPPTGFPSALTTGPHTPGLIADSWQNDTTGYLDANGRLTTTGDDTTYENFHAESIIVNHKRCTFDNFIVSREETNSWWVWVFYDGDASTPHEISYGTVRQVDGSGDPVVGTGGIHVSNANFSYMDLGWYENGLDCGDNVDVRECYIHDLWPYESAHPDGIAGGSPNNIYVYHNTIIMPTQTGCINLGGYAGSSYNLEMENNYFAGGSYSIYHDASKGQLIDTVIYRNNVFKKDSPIYGYVHSSIHQCTNVTWENNRTIDESGDTPVYEDLYI